MNPRTAINDLLPFQGSPFSLLGTSPNCCLSINNIRRSRHLQRRGWDSNPCALADKRFSRPPRYDHFDTSPCGTLLTSALIIVANQSNSVNTFFVIILMFFINRLLTLYFSVAYEKDRLFIKFSAARRSSGVVILMLV